MSNRFYFDRGILAELEYHSNHHSQMITDLDQIESALNDVKSHTGLISSRTSNIQDWVGTSDGVGGGVKTGVNIAEILVDTDQIVSKLTDVASHTGLISSRSSNIQDWVGTEGGDGTGAKLGVMVKSMDTKLGTLETDVEATNTLLTTMDGVLDNILTKNTEIDVAQDLTNTKLSSLETDVESTNTLLTTIDGVLDASLVKQTSIETHLDPTTTLQTLYTNITLAAGYTTTIDMSAHRHLCIAGSTTTSSATIMLAFSNDDSNYYPSSSHSITLNHISGIYYISANFPNLGAKYVRVHTSAILSNTYLLVSKRT